MACQIRYHFSLPKRLELNLQPIHLICARLVFLTTSVDRSVLVEEKKRVERDDHDLAGDDFRYVVPSMLEGVVLALGDERRPDLREMLQNPVGPGLHDVVWVDIIVADRRDNGDALLKWVVLVGGECL
jgi:hypothetical protein